MGFYSTTLETPKPHLENPSCTKKTASRDFFDSNRKFTYKIERNPLKMQQGKLQTTYKTASGRSSWPSRDPIGEWGGVNLYAFCYNDGINKWDRLGNAPRPVNGGFGMDYGREQGFFKDRAGGRNNPNVGTGQSGYAILEHMTELSEDNCCIKRYIIASHMGPGTVYQPRPGPGGLHEYSHTWIPGSNYPTDRDDGYYRDNNKNVPGSRDVRVDMQKAIDSGDIEFCKDCTILLYGCKIGNAFIQRLASVTGCKVYGINGGKCSPGTKDKWWQAGTGGTWMQSDGGANPTPVPGIRGGRFYPDNY